MMSSSSNCFPLAGAVILLLVLMAATESEAIRLDAVARASLNSSGGKPIMSSMKKPIGTNVVNVVKGSAGSTSETKRSVHVAADEVTAVAHKLPEFHEDYYGPSDHSPRHH
uniref:Uncharacterized protein n=1 Tax=Hordeum vulgare subsp. vulgare TaxID=112509 RepID=A0A8I6Y8J2_HORVV